MAVQVLALAFTSDGTRLAIGGKFSQVVLRETDSGQLIQNEDGDDIEISHEDWVRDVAFAPDDSVRQRVRTRLKDGRKLVLPLVLPPSAATVATPLLPFGLSTRACPLAAACERR